LLGKDRRLLYLSVENPGMKKYLAFFLLSTSVFISSCEDHYGICNVSRAVYLEADFVKLNGGTESQFTVPSLSMSVLNSNTSIFNNVSNQNEFRVLLNAAEDTLHYFIKVDPAMQADTLSVVYSSQPFAISEECGTISVYNLTEVYSTRNTIDSVALTSATVNNTSGQNLKLYF